MARVAATPGRAPAKEVSPAARAISYVKKIATPAPKRVAATPAAPKRVAATPARATSSSSSGRTTTTGGSGGGYSGGGSTTSGGYSGTFDGGGGGGGGGVSSISDFAQAAPAAPIEVPDPMADVTYQRQTGELARAMADFQAQQGLAGAQYDQQYGMGLRRLGWDQQGGKRSGFQDKTLPEGGGWSRDIPGAYAQSYNANEGDFAGRGLYNSGLYTRSVSDLNEDFTDRKNTMDVARTDWRSTQDMNRKNLENSQETTRQSALTDAISRIAAQYGVNLSDVTPGKANQVMR